VYLLILSPASKPIPSEAPSVSSFNIFDDFNLVPEDGMLRLGGEPDQQIVVALSFFDQKVPGNEQYRSAQTWIIQ
jgi:hypothetical protein